MVNEFDAIDQYLLNLYEQLAASVDLYLDSPQECSTAYLDLMIESLSELNEFKSKNYPPDDL